MKDFFRVKIEAARDNYLKDMEAMPHEQLAQKTGKARSAYDFTFEVTVINKRTSARLRNEDPGEWLYGDGFPDAPTEWQDKARACSEFKKSMDEILDAWNALSDEEIAKMEGTNIPVGLAHFTCIHAMYHDAQLNYKQSLAGDVEVHW